MPGFFCQITELRLTLVEMTFLHAAWKHADNFYLQNVNYKIQGAYMETFCRITMLPPLFELKLKKFPLPNRLLRIVHGSLFKAGLSLPI